MNIKIKNLFNKIRENFINGEYGVPTIPTKKEIMFKISELTEKGPLTKHTELENLNIDHIRNNFDNIIDDIDILYDSIETYSKEVLDQLTHSLKEHRGVKRELKRIQSRNQDISDGKLGEDYLEYSFTERFNDYNNINTSISDPIDLDAGVFSISESEKNNLSLNHYDNTKLNFNITENYSQVKSQGYVGTTDASAILDEEDPRQLVYKVRTNNPTRLVLGTTIQLKPDGKFSSINKISLNVDSRLFKGHIRIYYKDSVRWNNLPVQSTLPIDSDNIVFNFTDVECTHIKIEFIKSQPDVNENNEYYYIINNLSISRSTNKKKSVLYSKAIELENYDNELPVINSIETEYDGIVPKNTSLNLYVAKDKKFSGEFLDSSNSPVVYNSPSAYKFDPEYSGTAFLSELKLASDTVSGVELYKQSEFEWNKIDYDSENNTPANIKFENLNVKPQMVNSLFAVSDYYIFGDNTYSGIYNISGWVNTDNPSWNLMEPLVESGLLVSGVDVATIEGVEYDEIEDSSGNLNDAILNSSLYSGQWAGYSTDAGYPFNYETSDGSIFNFGEYRSSIDGWYRKHVNSVTPYGISYEYSDTNGHLDSKYNDNSPDFYFNNIRFYNIYKFGYDSTVVEPSIKLYTYQERPVKDNDYYPCNFTWNYIDSYSDKIVSKNDESMSTIPSDWTTYKLTLPELEDNETYVKDPVYDVRFHGTTTYLDDNEYQITVSDGIPTEINLATLAETRSKIDPSTVTFDYKLRYKIKNKYSSYWEGFAIVSPNLSNSNIKITNQDSTEGLPIISSVEVKNLDTGKIQIIEEGDKGSFLIEFDSTEESNSHYKISIFCSSNENNGFCKNNWTPINSTSDNTIEISEGIKIVQRIDPLLITDLSKLVYDTPINKDNRAAVYENHAGEKFIAVKIPSKSSFPGYYYNTISKKYVEYNKKIENIGHWIRRGVSISDGLFSDEFFYTTGSKGNTVYKKNMLNSDSNWNNGKTLTDYPNDRENEVYYTHSTYGCPLNVSLDSTQDITLKEGDYDPRAPYNVSRVGSSSWLSWLNINYPNEYRSYTSNSDNILNITTDNRGFLFHNTAENLPTYYSIYYQTVKDKDRLYKRFLYKLELESDESGSVAPLVKKLRFKFNL